MALAAAEIRKPNLESSNVGRRDTFVYSSPRFHFLLDAGGSASQSVELPSTSPTKPSGMLTWICMRLLAIQITALPNGEVSDGGGHQERGQTIVSAIHHGDREPSYGLTLSCLPRRLPARATGCVPPRPMDLQKVFGRRLRRRDHDLLNHRAQQGKGSNHSFGHRHGDREPSYGSTPLSPPPVARVRAKQASSRGSRASGQRTCRTSAGGHVDPGLRPMSPSSFRPPGPS